MVFEQQQNITKNGNEAQQLPFNLSELGDAWNEIISQLVVKKLVLKKQNTQLQTDYNQIEIAYNNLKAQLHQAQVDLLAAQGKAIIDKSRVES